MDYLENLRVFRAVVEAKSFRRAGDMLGLAPPIVSRAIASLEQRLGTRLFNRTTRQISLTESAERVYERCCRVLDDLGVLEAEATTETHVPAGILRLVAHTTAAVERLVPLISSFKLKYPNISLDVTLTERPVDLVAEGFDLGIVLPFMLSTDTAVTRLLERMPLAVFATSDYLKSHQRPTHPAQIEEHLFVTMPPALRKPHVTFRTEEEEVTVPIKYDIVSNNAVFNREMVLRGLGLGLLPLALVQPELQAGRLVRLLDEYEIMEESIEIRLAYATRTLLPAKVRAFIDHATGFYEELTGEQPSS
ncbi:LysR substrate-binding domain-containing protein [Trinickia sp. YCB016]